MSTVPAGCLQLLRAGCGAGEGRHRLLACGGLLARALRGSLSRDRRVTNLKLFFRDVPPGSFGQHQSLFHSVAGKQILYLFFQRQWNQHVNSFTRGDNHPSWEEIQHSWKGKMDPAPEETDCFPQTALPSEFSFFYSTSSLFPTIPFWFLIRSQEE